MKARSMIAGIFLLLAAQADLAGARVAETWREAFQSSPAARQTEAQFREFAAQLKIPQEIQDRMRPKQVSGTIRYRMEISAGGTQVRVRLSNEESAVPLQLSAVSVGLAGAAFDAVPGSLSAVTFGGKPGIVIPAGAPAVSDPVTLAVRPGTALLVSVHGPREFSLSSNGGNALAAAPGDQVMANRLASSAALAGRPLVSGISVRTPASTKVVVTLGDSITDGNRAQLGVLHSWPEQLARRLAARRGKTAFAVANAGIGGNRILSPPPIAEMGISALARLDRDVLRIDGLSHIVLLEGTNDIGMSGPSMFGNNPVLTLDDLLAGYRQIIARAHARGVKVLVATIVPFGGSTSHYSPEKERLRQSVNAWIRTSGEPDGVVDFDAAIRDPADPVKMQARYDSGDHLHPNEAGSKAMGDSINLALFD